MTLSDRTMRDMVYKDILKRLGPLSTKELAKEAHSNPNFRSMNLVAIEKDALRFAQHYDVLEVIVRKDGKLHWLSTDNSASNKESQIKSPSPLLNSEGFLTSRAGVKCEHCGLTIDLTKVPIKWRLKSRKLQLALHVHHFILITCPHCGWLGRYDTQSDVLPLLGSQD
jgi:hypothetical protein